MGKGPLEVCVHVRGRSKEPGSGKSPLPPLSRTGAHSLGPLSLDTEAGQPRVSGRPRVSARKLEERGPWIQTTGSGVQLLCDPEPVTQHLSLGPLVCKVA